MREVSELEERRLESFLEPLHKIGPVTRRQTSQNRRRWLAVAIVIAAVAVAGGSVAAAYQFGVLHQAEVGPSEGSALAPGGPFQCENVLGIASEEAERLFSERGFTVSWRFTRYGNEVTQGSGSEPQGVEGSYTSILKRPPPGSVVEDVLVDERDAQTVIVFVRDRNDPNAPRISPLSC